MFSKLFSVFKETKTKHAFFEKSHFFQVWKLTSYYFFFLKKRPTQLPLTYIVIVDVIIIIIIVVVAKNF
jgi:hypothetical protein